MEVRCSVVQVTKDYMEWYALLSLIYSYDTALTLLEKGEEPDWQSAKLDLGLEVTEALLSEDGRKRAVINQYFGKELDGQYIKEQIEHKYPEYSHQMSVIGKIACFSESYDMMPKVRQVGLAISMKTRKLNQNYTRFANNWLYVFAPSLFTQDDIHAVCQICQENNQAYAIQFDKVFFNVNDKVFVVSITGTVEQILDLEDFLARLKKEAQEKASNQKIFINN